MQTDKKEAPRKGIRGILTSWWAANQILVGLAALAAAVLIPMLLNQPYITSVATNFMIYSVLCLSLNLITGFMNITSLGHAAFYGIGAYTAAITSTRFGLPFYLTLPLAIVVAALFGLLLGLPTLRIRGRYLAIVTLGFCEITRIVELNWMSLTRGPMGISGIPSFTVFGTKVSNLVKYFIVLALVLFTIYVVHAIMSSRTGRAVTAIRDDDVAAEAMGINVFRYKLLIFAVSSGLAGLAGAFYAHHISFIDPKLFTFDQSILILSMTILGGMGSIPGSIVGALALTVIPELLRGLMEYRQIIYGLVIVVVVITRPNGLFGGINLGHILKRDRFEKQGGGKGTPPLQEEEVAGVE